MENKPGVKELRAVREAEVKRMMAKCLGISEEIITSSAKFYDDLGADSLDGVLLTIFFEKRYGIEIPMEAINEFNTAAEAVNYLEKIIPLKFSPEGRES